MPYPAEYYFYQTVIKQNYTHYPHGTPDIMRALKGYSDYWLSTGTSLEKKPKSLIIGPDWSAVVWSHKKTIAVKEAIEELLRQGFQVYLWQAGILKPLVDGAATRPKDSCSTSQLMDITLRRSLTTLPEDPRSILESAATQLRLSQDEVHVLDDYGINQLLYDHNNTPRSLSISDFQAQGDSTYADKILNYFEHASPPLHSLILDEYSSYAIQTTLANLKSRYPTLPIIITYRKVRLSSSDIETLESERKSISINDVYFNFEYFINIDELSITDTKPITPSLLQTLLLATPKLKKMQLSSYISRWGDLELPHGSLPYLEELNLYSNRIETQRVQTLLATAPHLKLLNLSRCEILYADFELPPSSLPYLEVLNLSYSSISTRSLYTLITAAPHLKELDLTKYRNLYEALELPPNSLSYLEVLNLSYSDISTQSLHTLIAAAPQLKRIYLVDCNNITEDLKFSPGTLPQLKQFHLSKASSISIQNLQVLLTGAPHLKIISFSNLENISKDLELLPCSLNHLKSINLNYSKISTKNLQILLNAAPHIKLLNLRYCENLDADFELLPNSLPYLEEINLSSSNISSQNLQTLIAAAPHLKIINLSNCKKITEDLELPPNSLANLEKLDLRYSPINARNIQTLQATAPKINWEEMQEQLSLHAPYSGGSASAFPSIIPPMTSSELSTKTITHHPRHQRIRSLDADTRPIPGQTISVKRLFYSINHHPEPKPNNYRLALYNTASTHEGPCGIMNAFRCENRGDLALEACHPPIIKAPFAKDAATSDECYYGKQHLRLSEEWQALASLSPEEQMLRYHTFPELDVEIQYSKRDNQYYIRHGHGRADVDIDFTLRIPPKEQKILATEIQALADDFRTFGSAALSLSAEEHSGEDYLDAINTQRLGACRHRAFAFKKKMDQRGIPARIIVNDCHVFVEVLYQDKWHTCDLGGYPADLNIDERHHPRPQIAHDPEFDFDNALQTWKNITPPTDKAEEYYQWCVSGGAKKHLIECATAQDSDALHYALQAHCRQISRAVFYVHSPEELLCMVSYMHRHEDNTGELRRGPSGPLHTFLTHPENANGVLLISFASFKSNDFVRFNTIIDEIRSIDGIPLPKNMLLLGLLAKDAAVIPGNDFYSRADRVTTCTLSRTELARAYPALPMPTNETHATRPYPIPLYHASDWMSRLLGQWLPEGKVWRYQEGLLQQALASGTTHIELQNGLWDDEDFVRFWREAEAQGFIEYAGTRITLPKGFLITQQNGYDWTHLSSYVRAAKTPMPSSTCILVNPSLLADLFTQYQTSPEKNLCRIPGEIAKACAKTPAELELYLTHNLSDDQWAMILQACAAQTPTLTVILYTAPGVVLPSAMAAITTPIPEIPHRDEAFVIQSTDVDTTTAIWLAQHPESLVLDVSECEASDLLSYVDGKLVSKDDKALCLQFETVTCAVSEALARGQSVVLKGQCSTTLAQALAPLLWQRITSTPAPEGYLLIIAEDTSYFSYLPTARHEVRSSEKEELLGETSTELAPYLTTEALMKLAARQRFQRHNPSRDSSEAWQGLSTLAVKHQHIAPLLLDDTARQYEAKAFTQQRKDAINAVFDREEPYVYLAGLSGVGKTTFVTDVFIDPSRDILYQGEVAILAWATDTTADKQKYLFIDEANLSTTQYSIFEGLFNTPPGILINGQYHILSPEHKVIFAGNPMQYKGGRSIAPFFQRHGNTVIFDPLSSNVIYEDILKPIFANSPLENQSLALCQPLLAIYSYLCCHSTTDILISPRELEMIALLTLSRCCDDDKDIPDAQQVAAHFAYQLTHALVPAQHKREFDIRFKANSVFAPLSNPNTADYLLTPSHQQAYALLDDCLSLREKRPEALHRIQRSGGLGGMVLEGNPGNGKSELVLQALRARDYQEIPLQRSTDPHDEPRSFYRIPVSLADSEKEICLIHAFHQGAVVVIEEINSAPRMERLLNALLMGKTPEGIPAKNPGFMIIGTQNPITRAGRRAASPALARRFITEVIADYSDEEKWRILYHKGLRSNDAQALITSYNKQAAFAKKHHLNPEPTFRDLLKLANRFLERRHLEKTIISYQHSLPTPLTDAPNTTRASPTFC